MFTPGEAESSRFSVRYAQPLPSHDQGLDFFSPPLPPSHRWAPGTWHRQRKQPVSPHPTFETIRRGLSWGLETYVEVCACMCVHVSMS